MDVQVDEAWGHHFACGVNDLAPLAIQPGPHLLDDPIPDAHIGFHQPLAVEYPAASHDRIHGHTSYQSHRARLMAAMRTNTPLFICLKMRERSHSTTSSAISTPRLKGAGCMMMAPSFSQASLFRSMP